METSPQDYEASESLGPKLDLKNVLLSSELQPRTIRSDFSVSDNRSGAEHCL